MRLAAFNVENLFDRPKAMNQENWSDGRSILERFAQTNAILAQPAYSAADKTRLMQLLTTLGLAKSDTGPFVLLRQNRGKLVKRPRTGGIEIEADGRNDWIGWLELRTEPVNERAIRNTAQVIVDVKADVLAVVEAESRPVLEHFSKELLPVAGGVPYNHVMLIDGNDERGIDVALMTGKGFPISDMRSHVDDRLASGTPVFSRDCPEYLVTTPRGARLWVLPNHYKSKGFGDPATSNARRLAQSVRTADIYNALTARGEALVAVVGDLNDFPGSAPLAPLLDNTDLTDVSSLSGFEDGGFPGTFGSTAGPTNKIDYVLMSPALMAKATAGGLFRTGVWSGTRKPKWPVYPTMEKPEHAASDHAAIWVDLDI